MPTAEGQVLLTRLASGCADVASGQLGPPRLRETALAIAATGDDAARRAALESLIAVVPSVTSSHWRDIVRPVIQQADAVSKLTPTPKLLEEQVDLFSYHRVLSVLDAMGAIGASEVGSFYFRLAEDPRASTPAREAALEALGRSLDAHDTAAMARCAVAWAHVAPIAGGRASIGCATVTGGDLQRWSRIAAGMAGGIGRCTDRGLQQNSAMGGSVQLAAEIAPNGDVLSVRCDGGACVGTSTGLDGGVVSCLASSVSAAHFDPFKEPGATLVIPVTVVGKEATSR
jgi:hypothetical protein